MLLITWRFVTLLFTALALGMAFAHLLEMPPKMRYPASLWMTLQLSLYRAFAPAGAILETGSVIFAAVLVYLVRGRWPAFLLTLVGAVCLATAFVVWFIFTAPANTQVNRWTAESPPADWRRWRNQWEYSHAGRAILFLLGFGTLLASVLSES
jgi:anthrone oxygenase-like protein